MLINDTVAYYVDHGNTFTWSASGAQVISGSGSDSINLTWNSLGNDSVIVSIYDSNGCFVGNLNMTVVIYDISTDIYYHISDGIKVYPNPFDNYTRISFDNSANTEHTLFIYDLVGELKRTINNITQSEFTIDKGDLTKGVYIIEIRAPGRSLITKIMVD